MTKLSPRAKRIMREYLSRDLCLGEYDVHLKIGVQGFNVRTCAVSKRAEEWHRRMLAHALDNFLTMEAEK
jgi:hypothetical protein